MSFYLSRITIWFFIFYQTYSVQIEENARIPFVLRNDMLHSLTEVDLLSTTAMLRNVYTRSNHIFTYYDDVPENRMPDFLPPSEMVTIASAAGICDPNDDKFYYYSSEIIPSPFSTAISHDRVIKSVFNERSFIRSEDVTTTIWIGEQQVLVTPHYDGVHNLFIQQTGTKRVLLLPPVRDRDLFLHGKLHPLARQSRIVDLRTKVAVESCYHLTNNSMCSRSHYPLRQLDDSPIADITQGSEIEIILQPGDMLYIPPYWIHETVAESCSVSFSLWWDPLESKIMSGLLEFPLPSEEHWSSFHESHQALTHYLTHFLRYIQQRISMTSDQLSDDYVFELLYQRYLEDLSNLHASTFTSNSCLQSEEGRCNSRSLSTVFERKVQRYAEATANYLMEELTDAIREERSLLSMIRIQNNESLQYFSPTLDSSIHTQIGAIAALKACDYVEEVAMFVASWKLDDEARNIGQNPSYGTEHQTAEAVQLIKEVLEEALSTS